MQPVPSISRGALAVLLSCLLPAIPAQASEWQSEPASVWMSDSVELFADQTVDSGYWPSSGDPIAVRFYFTPVVELNTELEGTSQLGWGPEPLSRGVTGTGIFAMDVDVGLGAEVKLDLFGIYSGIVPIASTGIVLDAETESEGLWLPGAPEESATLVVDDPSLVPPFSYGVSVIPGVELVLSVGIAPQLEATMTGVDVTSTMDGESVLQLTEGGTVELPPLPDRPGELGLLTHWTGQLESTLAIVLTPAVSVDTPLGDFTLAEFPLPIELTTISQQRTTEPQFVIHPLPVLRDLPPSYAYGDVPAGTLANWPVPIENIGELLLEGTVTVVGDPAFSVWPPTLAALPGEDSGFVVSFAPEAPGEYEGLLVITTNDPGRPEVQVPLSGTSSKGSAGTGDDPPDFEGDDPGDPSQIKTCGCGTSGLGWRQGWAGLFVLLSVCGRRKLSPST